MTWRGPRTRNDPTLSSTAWAKVKQHWLTLKHPACQARPCLMPGIPISYTPPFTKPASFNCGHIVPRWKAKALGWTAEQMNALTNSRPEHRKCNLIDGARIGQKRQAKRQAVRVRQLDESRRW